MYLTLVFQFSTEWNEKYFIKIHIARKEFKTADSNRSLKRFLYTEKKKQRLKNEFLGCL